MLLLLFISILPCFLIGLYIYKKDKDREPKKLIIKLFLGGVCSTIMSLILSLIVGIFVPSMFADVSSLNLLELIFHAFFCVALIEETSKWFFVYIISFDHKEFNQTYDMIVYSAFVALGFACLENIFYVLDNGLMTGIIRALFSVPGHACNGVFMGYYLSIAKLASINGNKTLKNKNIFLSILVPVLLHGFYDYCLFSGLIIFILLFLAFIVLLYIFTIRKIIVMSKNNRNLINKANFCPDCGTKLKGNFCTWCGRRNN